MPLPCPWGQADILCNWAISGFHTIFLWATAFWSLSGVTNLLKVWTWLRAFFFTLRCYKGKKEIFGISVQYFYMIKKYYCILKITIFQILFIFKRGIELFVKKLMFEEDIWNTLGEMRFKINIIPSHSVNLTFWISRRKKQKKCSVQRKIYILGPPIFIHIGPILFYTVHSIRVLLFSIKVNKDTWFWSCIKRPTHCKACSWTNIYWRTFIWGPTNRAQCQLRVYKKVLICWPWNLDLPRIAVLGSILY